MAAGVSAAASTAVCGLWCHRHAGGGALPSVLRVMSHCGRDPSVVGCCGGTDQTCSCECMTCRCPNCSALHVKCQCVKRYFCTHCKLTPDEAKGGACESLSGPEHDWDWTF